MKIIKTLSKIVQTVLMAPIKLPGKALSIIKYIALGLGIIETVIDDKEEQNADKQLSKPPDQDAESGSAEQTLDSADVKDKSNRLSTDHTEVDKTETSKNQLSDTVKLAQGIIEYEEVKSADGNTPSDMFGKTETSENQLSETLKMDQGIIEYDWEPEGYTFGNGKNNETEPQDKTDKGKEVPDEGQ